MPEPTTDFSERLVLDFLLRRHPRLIELAQLEHELTDVVDARSATRALIEDGLVTRLGDLVGASRAAVRTAALRD